MEHHEFVLPRLPADFDGFRIVQITDIHMDGWMTAARLAGIVARANAENPDIVVLTGDYVTDHAGKFAPALTAELSRLSPRLGTYAVLGNHDYWSNSAIITAALQAAKITVLANAVVAITCEHSPAVLYVAGLDDAWINRDDLPATVAQLPADDSACAILLVHEPDIADDVAATGRFDLQLSGHSHGGQVVIPFFGPPILPPLGRKYPRGRYQISGMWLHTSRGVGTLHYPIRLACRPELTVLTVRRPSPSS